MDKQRALRLLGYLERALGVAEGLVALGGQEFHGDIRNRYALRMAIVEIVEAAAALGLLILREDLGLVEVEGYADVFIKLAEHGVVSGEVGEGMARLRNLIVHRYWEIDDMRIYLEAKRDGLGLVRRFIREAREYVGGPREG